MKLGAIIQGQARKKLMRFRPRKSLTAKQVEKFLAKNAPTLRREVVENLASNPGVFRKFFPSVKRPRKWEVSRQGFFILKSKPKRRAAKGGRR